MGASNFQTRTLPRVRTEMSSQVLAYNLRRVIKILGSESFQYTEPITLVGLFFLVFSLVSAALIRRVEQRLKQRAGRRT